MASKERNSNVGKAMGPNSARVATPRAKKRVKGQPPPPKSSGGGSSFNNGLN